MHKSVADIQREGSCMSKSTIKQQNESDDMTVEPPVKKISRIKKLLWIFANIPSKFGWQD
jgi:hypothetical protein